MLSSSGISGWSAPDGIGKMTYMLGGKQYPFTVGTPTQPAETVALALEP